MLQNTFTDSITGINHMKQRLYTRMAVVENQNDRYFCPKMTVMCTKMTVSQVQNDRYENFFQYWSFFSSFNYHFGITTVISVKSNGLFWCLINSNSGNGHFHFKRTVW